MYTGFTKAGHVKRNI